MKVVNGAVSVSGDYDYNDIERYDDYYYNESAKDRRPSGQADLFSSLTMTILQIIDKCFHCI